MGQTLRGRASVFRGKQGGRRYAGTVTKTGSKAFEAKRRELAGLVDRKAADISDADVIEFQARGVENTRKYLGLS